MKVRYVFPLVRSMKIDDHWVVPLLGGQCRLIEEDGLVTKIEFTKRGLSTDLAFTILDTPDNFSKATITGHDNFLPFVRDHIERAFSFLQCYFDTRIIAQEVQIYHEAETPDEDKYIAVPSFHLGRKEEPPLPITYDFLTRALMASEDHHGPDFVSSLALMARESLKLNRYIGSFRFSFLLIESIYGGGKFKSKQLKQEMLASGELTRFIQNAIDEWQAQPVDVPSPTNKIMASGASVEKVIDHLIDMRGHYFHGNIAKKDAWNLAKQDEAKALAFLSVAIAQSIASEAAAPLFVDAYGKRHFIEAGLAGAHIVMDIIYHFRAPEDDFIRTRRVDFRMPGTKPTTAMAMEAAWRSVQNFQQQLPVGRLHSVSGKNSLDGTEVFSIRFLTEKDGQIVDG